MVLRTQMLIVTNVHINMILFIKYLPHIYIYCYLQLFMVILFMLHALHTYIHIGIPIILL